MQLMSWPVARLGSRFGLLFEPYYRRVQHSGLGRFLDAPLDLAVGLVEPDGTERVLPFTQHGELFYNCEQFERINSITFRGHDEKIGLKFELNIHSPFYPQDEELCLSPAFYMEMRVTWARKIRWMWTGQNPLDKVRVFIRLNRPETHIDAADGRINLSYDVPLTPCYHRAAPPLQAESYETDGLDGKVAHVEERIVSLNDGAEPMHTDTGVGLTLDLPIAPDDSGTKWRLVWGSHCADPLLEVRRSPARLRYLNYFENIDAVLDYAIAKRDDNLAHSRRFERLLEQAPLVRARRHLLALGFQTFLADSFWCDTEEHGQWFSVWDGNYMHHSPVDVDYNIAVLYLSLWPDLLRMLIDQWVYYGNYHPPCDGVILSHDMGQGLIANGQRYPHSMPVEENSDFLLLLQAYGRWTGDRNAIDHYAEFVEKLARYLIWTDRDGSGFPSEGVANTVDDASPAVQYSRKQTYLAIKRVAALQAAADLLGLAGREEIATRCRDTVRLAVPQIESEAWLGDHYAVCIDKDATGLVDVWTGKALPSGDLEGWDDYSIYTANGWLLPVMVDRDLPFDLKRIQDDITNSLRETQTPYGCAHTSSDTTNIRISQNMWRDTVGRYLKAVVPPHDARYWDLMVAANTHHNSLGFIEAYITNESGFYSRGAVGFGFFLAGPRIKIDRLTGDGTLSVDPDHYRYSRWPLLPLADWKAGRIPICVVDGDGRVFIEGEIEKVHVVGGEEDD